VPVGTIKFDALMKSFASTIRAELPGDEDGIRRVHNAAFPSPLESRLVDALRGVGRLTISRVAAIEAEIVGHIAFSPITINDSIVGLGLAPLAVAPSFQRQGIGSILLLDSLGECAANGVGLIVVLGEPSYYSRFGFKHAAQWNLSDEYKGGEAFQAIELITGAIPAGGGLVQYAPEFSIFAG
jgi:putative acetyltransferase